MRILRIISGLFFLLAIWRCDTSSNIEPVFKDYFIRFYGGNGNHFAEDVLLTSAGQLIILGNVSYSASFNRMYLLITDLEGNVLVEKALGVNQESARDIEPITAGSEAGNFVILSNVRKNPADSLAIRLTIINAQGDSLRSYYYNSLKSQEGFSVTPLSNGGYFVGGRTTDTDPDPSAGNVDLGLIGLVDKEDELVLSINPDFTVQYIRRIGGSTEGACVKILQGPSPFYYYAGYSDRLDGTEAGIASNYEHNFNFRVFTTNPASVPNLVSGAPDQQEVLKSIAQSSTGIFMALGTRLSNPNRPYAALLTSTFSLIDAGILPVSAEGYEAVHVAPSGGSRFLVALNRIGAGNRSDIWVGRVTSEFVIDFQKTFGGPNTDDRVSRVMELPGGDVLVLGTMDITNQRKIALIKLRPNGNF